MSATNGNVENLIEATVTAVTDLESSNGHHQSLTPEEQEAVWKEKERFIKTRSAVWGGLFALFVVGLILVFTLNGRLAEWEWSGGIPKNADLAALQIMRNSPVIDGHIDLPILARFLYSNNATAIDLESPMPAHVDIPRLRKGQVGGFFWSVFVGCVPPSNKGKAFKKPTWQVRDTLEQIDVARLLIDKYPGTFKLAGSSDDMKNAIAEGKIASLLGVEGAHQLGNSIAVMRQYYALGVRYVTLTHSCHNAFADSCGIFESDPPLHGGLSPIGYSLIDEMNRLGMLVDLSHTSDATASQALNYSKAPVIWSHSSARAVYDVPRNVPDFVLEMIGEGKKDAVVMINFSAGFVAPPGEADVQAVANHVEHVAKIAGKKHVGLGSDFDGIEETPVGLEDVSKYPALIAELFRRGWSKYELADLTGANLLRVFAGAEAVAKRLQGSGALPVQDLYSQRPDLPRPTEIPGLMIQDEL